MEEIKVNKLKNYFTMSKRTMRELYDTLEVTPAEVMKVILELTEDPGNLAQADTITQLLYFTEMAYKQGYVRALYEVNEANKQTIKDLTIK